MARTNKKVKKRWPQFGLPIGLVLLAGRGGTRMDGWRTMVTTEKPAGVVCGGLPGVRSGADPEEAQRAAVETVRWMAWHYHRQEVDVVWDPQREPDSWTATVTVVVAGSTISHASEG